MTALADIKKSFDVGVLRQDFPILHQKVNGYPLVYLDNAATTQKPSVVVDAIRDYYLGYNANVHRGAHFLSDKATEVFEQARTTVSDFINSPKSEQVIWTRGTTESINLVAHSWGHQLRAGDVILVSYLEHHSNIVPWQLIAEQRGAEVKPIPITDTGDIDIEAFKLLLDDRVKLVAVNHVSNALGTVNPVKQITELAHAAGALCLVDGAQSVGHFPVDVQTLDCDFFVFSAHKLFGPTGIGVLWGKAHLLDSMSPYQGGGEMIESVRFDGTTFNQLPYKFEAGTPNIAGAIGLKAAIDYVQSYDRAVLTRHEDKLVAYALQKGEEHGLQPIGHPKLRAGVYSFLIPNAHPADVGTLLDQQGLAVRTGHHCAQPLMHHFSIPGTVRASFSIYNTHSEVDALFSAIEKVRTFL